MRFYFQPHDARKHEPVWRLRPPPRVRLDGNYTSIKRVNSTHGHWGVMALWQMRGAYAD